MSESLNERQEAEITIRNAIHKALPAPEEGAEVAQERIYDAIIEENEGTVKTLVCAEEKR